MDGRGDGDEGRMVGSLEEEAGEEEARVIEAWVDEGMSREDS